MTEQSYAILLNAPKSCGKTESIKYMIGLGLPLVGRSCKDPLHRATMAFFGVQEDLYWELYQSRELKEKPNEIYKVNLPFTEYLSLERVLGESLGTEGELWLSPRQAMIYVSEVIIKPRFGEQVFGIRRADSIEDSEIVVDDSTAAFEVEGEIRADEIYPLIDKLGNDNILLIRVHREGFDFSGDSRRYVPDGVCVNTIDIFNEDEDFFYESVYNVVLEFLSKRMGLHYD